MPFWTGDQSIFNARSAAIYGFSIFGKNHTYLLNQKGEIDYINLSQKPLEDSLVVYRNGLETELWYYLPSINTVYLDFVPDPGELIEVGYVVL